MKSLNKKQVRKLIELNYSNELKEALLGVFFYGVSIYRAERSFNLKEKTLRSKVQRIQKQVEMINEVLGA